MCSDIFQELHEWIVLALIILLSTYFEQYVTRKWWKSVFQSSKWNIQYFHKKWRKCCKSYQSSRLSSATTLTSFDLFSSTNLQSHLQTGVSDRVGRGSLHQIHLLKSLGSFLLHSFQKKDDFGTDMLAIVVCNLWMSEGNNNHRHLPIRFRNGQQTLLVVTILIGRRSIAKLQIPNSAYL